MAMTTDLFFFFRPIGFFCWYFLSVFPVQDGYNVRSLNDVVDPSETGGHPLDYSLWYCFAFSLLADTPLSQNTTTTIHLYEPPKMRQ